MLSRTSTIKIQKNAKQHLRYCIKKSYMLQLDNHSVKPKTLLPGVVTPCSEL